MRCPRKECNKAGAYVRVKTDDIFCRNCGKSTTLVEYHNKKQEEKKNGTKDTRESNSVGTSI